mmetsp:Transcript_22700/g.40151  ORF Transcript_22700/g.40151 Transcript_22700/m.40151 type:complete len:190 (-) Transcript_22700:153-722(-)|eukprot:CAMPEP_0197532242 /NCGR_PEP_ID=MMETSP1318-20131121/39013_1 /TAXON_ID=552666 /ORGANISM="Partenskyella glossopodia, Strain RCC365" /LENGTH=189 /DNA_ID=CAMNT_0043088737 /DNA_START=13 /DNA_END=582 /DNA_ORIENTATION=+
MSTVLGEDDESSSSEGENETHQPLATHVPNIITGEDSEEEEDTPHVGGAEGANMAHMPHLMLHQNAQAQTQGHALPSSGSKAVESGKDSKNARFGSKSSFQPTDITKITLTPAIKDLMEKNRRFLDRVPNVVNPKLQRLEDTLKETSRLVEQTLNTLQDIPIYAKLGINDTAKLCGLLDHSLTLLPRMK